MMSRKAQGGPSWATIVLVLCVVFLLTYLIFGGRIFGYFNDTSSSVSNEIDIGKCNVGGIFTPESDCDADDVRDKCDPCIDSSSSADTDDDGMPDACETDEAKDDPDTIECTWQSQDTTIQLGNEIHVCSIGPPDDNQKETYTLTPGKCPNNELAFNEITFEKNE